MENYRKFALYIAAAVLFVFLAVPLALTSWNQVCARKEVSGSVKTHLAIAKDFLGKKDYSRALLSLTKAREIDPNNPAIQTNIFLSRVLHFSENPDTFENRDIEDLKYEAAFLKNSGDFSKFENNFDALLAHIKIRTGKSDDGVTSYNKIIEKEQNNLAANIGLAFYYLNDKEKTDDAVAKFNLVLSAAPENISALRGLSRAMFMKGDYDGVIKNCESLLKTSEDFTARFLLGAAYLSKGDNNKAIIALQRATQLNNQSADSFILLGDALLAAELGAEAESAYQSAYNLTRSPDSIFKLARAYKQQKKFQQAVTLLNELYKADPQNLLVLFEFATVLEGAGMPNEALTLYKAIDGMPSAPQGTDPKIFEQIKAFAKQRIDEFAKASQAAPQETPQGKK
ncbi:MAG: tetratricopeptide repeat protein [Deltaproteobacteria bacterium]|nr:tetratricopeptide repeat protein [Deltaproteobacteria bacterium]